MFKLSPQDEVKKRLLQGHLSYLNRDDTPEKLIHKTKLEGLIVEYLSMVPHCNKFENIEVAECFDKSILENKDFTACRAASAFEVLEKYATSLLTKPWRKEFRTIYPYGGYMKGLVDKQLRGASKILYLMGYRNKNVNGVIVYSAESSIIDPDTLARVSLDCLIAFVELQMMIQIADALKRKNISLSWLQLLDLRASSICSMDQLVNYVMDSDKLIDFESENAFNFHSSKYGKQSQQLGQNKYYLGQQQQQQQQQQLKQSQPTQCHQNGCPVLRETRRKNDLPQPKEPVNYSSSDNSRALDLIHFSAEEQRSPNVIYHGIHTPTGYIAPPPMFASELSNNISSYADNHHIYNSHHYPPYLNSTHHQQLQQQQTISSSSAPISSMATNYMTQSNINDTFSNKNSIDVIDGSLSALNLKSTGSRLKNLDRRTSTSFSPRTSSNMIPGNYDTTRSDESCQMPVKNLVNNQQMNNTNNAHSHGVCSTSSNNSSNTAATNRRLEDRINAILKSFSDEDKAQKSSSFTEDPRERKLKDKGVAEKKSEMLDHRISSKSREDQSTSNGFNETASTNDNAWSCAYCTFLNANQTDICDMCSRSREKPGQESNSNLISGGRVCPVCTLVNSKDADRCSACEYSLLNSPTYI